MHSIGTGRQHLVHFRHIMRVRRRHDYDAVHTDNEQETRSPTTQGNVMTRVVFDDRVITAASAAHKPETLVVRKVGIVLFEGFSLLEAGMLAEAFHIANDIAASGKSKHISYRVWMLSAEGGYLACSCSLRLSTVGIRTVPVLGFDALYVGGGRGATRAVHDEDVIAWLRWVGPVSNVVRPIAEGRLLIEAAGLSPGQDLPVTMERGLPRTGDTGSSAEDAYETLKSALRLIKRDLGTDVACRVAERVLPDVKSELRSLLGDGIPATVRDKIWASASWLRENCARAISVAEAAQTVAMSERNFQRRFKLTLGMTPSDYLLQVRLDMTCRMLTDTDLPVDKVARHCELGNGERLARIFRNRLGLSPTEYRNRSCIGRVAAL